MQIFYPTCGPAGSPELRLDQLEAIYRIKHELEDGTGSVLVGAGMGSGKTVVTTEVIRKTKPKRVLIVGIKAAYSQWKKCFKEQGIIAPLYRIENTTVAGQDNMKRLLDGDNGFYYIGLEMLRAQDWETVSETWKVEDAVSIPGMAPIELSGTTTKRKQMHTYAGMKPVDLLVSDESHKHSNQKTSNLKTISDIPSRWKIALSGTFFGNRFENAWALATYLWGKAIIGTKTRFEFDYCVKVPLKKKDGTAVRTPGGFALSKILGERNPGEYVETLPCYVFIATPIGPPPPPEIVMCDLGTEQRRQYGQMEKQSLAWIPSSVTKGRAPLIADLPIVQRIRLRTAALGAMTLVPGLTDEDPDSIRFDPGCESTTLNTAYGVLHRPTWVGQKVLILTHSKTFAIEAARRIGLKYPVFLKTGDTNEKVWEEQKASFMRPVSETGVQYMVAVISAVGTATDGLQESCSKVLWLSEDENNVNNIQGSNRVWRDGVDLPNYEAVQIVQRNTIAQGVLKKNQVHKAHTLDSVAGIK